MTRGRSKEQEGAWCDDSPSEDFSPSEVFRSQRQELGLLRAGKGPNGGNSAASGLLEMTEAARQTASEASVEALPGPPRTS